LASWNGGSGFIPHGTDLDRDVFNLSTSAFRRLIGRYAPV